jgi:hypothetical protein
LVSDQVASLLVGVAADGLVDFSKAKLLDRGWNLKLRLLLKVYQDNKQAKISNLYFQRAVSALAFGSSETFKSAWALSDKAINLIEQLECPWLDRDRKPKKDYNEYRDLIEQYKRVIGDPDDPAFKVKIDEAVEELKRRSSGTFDG